MTSEADPPRGLHALGTYDFRLEDGDLLTQTKPLGYYIPPREAPGTQAGGSSYGWEAVDDLFLRGTVPVPRGTEDDLQRVFDQHAPTGGGVPDGLKWAVFVVSSVLVGLVVADLAPLVRGGTATPTQAPVPADPAAVEAVAATVPLPGAASIGGPPGGVTVGPAPAGVSLAALACAVTDLPPPRARGARSRVHWVTPGGLGVPQGPVAVVGAEGGGAEAAPTGRRPARGKRAAPTKSLMVNQRAVAAKD